ncbi:hypothetical protein SUDANB120_06205 (plasmid) [Streptomyces sp. enrichment culture]|uniref:hypothetical protein n=1 Tax=Streptomyces sp. enrichment culture TaxID=1795815 RepID=UPI003F575CD9
MRGVELHDGRPDRAGRAPLGTERSTIVATATIELRRFLTITGQLWTIAYFPRGKFA